MKFLQNPHDIAHLTISVLLHYLGKLKIQISCRYWRKSKRIAFLIASTFVIHPQMLISSVLKIVNLSLYWLQIKFSMSLFLYLFTLAINWWHRKFVTADVTALFDNNQHDIKRREQDFHKKLVFEGVHSEEVDRRISWKKLNKAWC